MPLRVQLSPWWEWADGSPANFVSGDFFLAAFLGRWPCAANNNFDLVKVDTHFGIAVRAIFCCLYVEADGILAQRTVSDDHTDHFPGLLDLDWFWSCFLCCFHSSPFVQESAIIFVIYEFPEPLSTFLTVFFLAVFFSGFWKANSTTSRMVSTR
jgi:hypothetical protein